MHLKHFYFLQAYLNTIYYLNRKQINKYEHFISDKNISGTYSKYVQVCIGIGRTFVANDVDQIMRSRFLTTMLMFILLLYLDF